jgi:DNA-binding NarL/FixJ family response regulator
MAYPKTKLPLNFRTDYASLVIKPMNSPCSNAKIKVLIADDSLIVREHLVTMIEELAGIEIVGQAENVAEAISAVRILKPDAVILDILMPGGSGFKVLQNIKQAGAGPMVIILTNYPYPVFRQKCLQAGADFFLDKSTEFDQIPELFERLKWGKS